MCSTILRSPPTRRWPSCASTASAGWAKAPVCGGWRTFHGRQRHQPEAVSADEAEGLRTRPGGPGRGLRALVRLASPAPLRRPLRSPSRARLPPGARSLRSSAGRHRMRPLSVRSTSTSIGTSHSGGHPWGESACRNHPRLAPEFAPRAARARRPSHPLRTAAPTGRSRACSCRSRAPAPPGRPCSVSPRARTAPRPRSPRRARSLRRRRRGRPPHVQRRRRPEIDHDQRCAVRRQPPRR